MAFKRDKKEEEEGGGNPFANIEKTTVLQEARTFNETPVNARKCTHILTKILYLINQGEVLGATEATEAFFAMTKLFQSRDVVLRRMVYLGIKELADVAQDVIIVTSSLMKDMTGKEDLYRAAAIRALCSITDATMLQSIERYMKQAIVDRSAAVSSAALVSSLHLSRSAPDMVRRWAPEAAEALSSDSAMVQYHALGVLRHLRQHDRLALTKLSCKLARAPPRSPYATCLLIRVAGKLLEEDAAGADSLFEFIEACLRHKSEMVVFEAAQAVVNLRRTTPRELAPAVSVLQLFCSSPKPTLRFAAVRTLNKVATSHPAAVAACNLDLENLISDSNRSVATLAITTLLKTGAESSVDRLMKQIAGFVSEISDEFKVVVVQAIRALCLKFPRKHAVLMNFLSAMLRDEGGLDYKAAIADTIITVIEENPEAKEVGLAHLCEFIEDCEHTSLAVRILHLLGREGPRSKAPARYIRFIYNRVILENAAVRAAAVAAMAQFGAACPDLAPNVLVLLARCQTDSDDEVRDRAALYSAVLESGDRALMTRYVLDTVQVSVARLEAALAQHLAAETAEAFDLRCVPPAPLPSPADAAAAALRGDDGIGATATRPTPAKDEGHAERLKAVPELAGVPGELFRSSEPQELTESETEYVVRAVKHVFPRHLVLQFDVTNTLSDQLLEDVRVAVEPPEGYALVKTVSCPRLPYGETHACYAVLQFPADLPACLGSVGTTLRFIVKDCDPNTGLPDSDEGYQDDYIVEDVEIVLADLILKVSKANFSACWEEASAQPEREDTFSLSSMRSLDEAVRSMVAFLGMQPAERSDRVPEGRSSHALFLAGVFRGGHEVLVRTKFALGDGVTMQLTVRSTDAAVADLVASAVA